jgi:hypothetical protein
VIVVVLVFKPSGLFGRTVVVRGQPGLIEPSSSRSASLTERLHGRIIRGVCCG